MHMFCVGLLQKLGVEGRSFAMLLVDQGSDTLIRQLNNVCTRPRQLLSAFVKLSYELSLHLETYKIILVRPHLRTQSRILEMFLIIV